MRKSGEKPIFMDYQSTTPVDKAVYKSMQPFFMEMFSNPHSSEHAGGWEAKKAVSRAARQVGSLIGADEDEIFFCSGATEANNLAILGLARRNKDRSRILVSSIEHKCVLEAAQHLERENYSIELIPVEKSGLIDIAWLEERIDDDVLLVSVMAVNNEIGTIQPLKEIGEIASSFGALFHCDAAQALCVLDIDVWDSKIDLLSLSGHKIYAPKGIGALYIRRDLLGKIEPLMYGGGQQGGIRPGTLPVPLCVGLGVACEILSSDSMHEERGRIRNLRDLFVTTLQERVNTCAVNGAIGELRHYGNANICFDGVAAEDILLALQPNLLASTGSACNSGFMESSYVLRAIGLSDEKAKSSIRFSFGRHSTENEVFRGVELIAEALELLS